MIYLDQFWPQQLLSHEPAVRDFYSVQVRAKTQVHMCWDYCHFRVPGKKTETLSSPGINGKNET